MSHEEDNVKIARLEERIDNLTARVGGLSKSVHGLRDAITSVKLSQARVLALMTVATGLGGGAGAFITKLLI